MRTDLALPQASSQVGVLLSVTKPEAPLTPRTVRIGMDGAVIEVVAFGMPKLTQALQAPLAAWTLQLAHPGDFTQLPILLGLAEDPFNEGLAHMPESTCPLEGVVAGIRGLIDGVKTAPLRGFLVSVFQRRDVFDAFWTMPASARDHHSVPGGLAMHTLEVATDLATHGSLSDLERDLGTAGALLHDIGKVWSYTEDMMPNTANLAMGHELVGLCRLEPQLQELEWAWSDGACVMRSLLCGNPRVRDNGSLPSALLPRIKGCDQRSCERDRAATGWRPRSRPVWTPSAWEARPVGDSFDF